jgi:hypothetical protein
MLAKIEEAIKNGQSRYTGNIAQTNQRMKTKKAEKHNTIEKHKRIRNTNPAKSGSREE